MCSEPRHECVRDTARGSRRDRNRAAYAERFGRRIHGSRIVIRQPLDELGSVFTTGFCRLSLSVKSSWDNVYRLMQSRGHLNLIRRKRTFRFSRQSLQIQLINYGFMAVVYPPGDRFTLQGQQKYFVPLPAWTPIRVLFVYFRTIFFRPQFIENQGPLVLGLVPVWYLIALRWDSAQLLAALGA